MRVCVCMLGRDREKERERERESVASLIIKREREILTSLSHPH